MWKVRYSRSAAHAGLLLAALGALAALSRVNFLLFHSATEMVSIGIAWGVFFITWNARRFGVGGVVLALGVGYFYVGVLDLLHVLSYRGLGLMHEDTNVMTQLWIGGRFIEAATLTGALLFLHRRLPPMALHAGFGVLVGALALSILVYPVFPDCFVPGSGPTTFKIGGQFAVIGLFAVAGLLLFGKRRQFEPAL